MKKVIGIGNVLVDALIRIPHDGILKDMKLQRGGMHLVDQSKYEEIGQTFLSLGVQRATGGSAGNTILALGNLGAEPGIFGKIGKDDNGEFFLRNCQHHGITPHLLTDETLPTGVASTFISPDGQRTFCTFLGAASQLGASDLDESQFDDYSYLYIEGYMVQNRELVTRAVRLAKQKGMLVCLDMASFNIVENERDFFLQLLTEVDIVFANEEEARAFSMGKSPRAALDELSRYCDIAVVKTGRSGAMARTKTEFVQMPIRPVVKRVDTTGAGDFFAAGFLYGHSQGDTLGECMRKATVLAAYVIQIVGTDLPEWAWDMARREVNPLQLLSDTPHS